MLKKIVVISGLALAMVASGAYATDSGTSTGDGRGDTKADACSIAKMAASNGAKVDASRVGINSIVVPGYSACDCTNAKHVGPGGDWSCNVDAQWTKR